MTDYGMNHIADIHWIQDATLTERVFDVEDMRREADLDIGRFRDEWCERGDSVDRRGWMWFGIR